jgi:signal transduction histidine kinase
MNTAHNTALAEPAGAALPALTCPREAFASWAFDAASARSVTLCRRTVRAILTAAWRLDEAYETLVEDALLITTELVTNVHRHVDGDATATVTLSWQASALSIRVHDRGLGQPRILAEPREGGTDGDWTGWGLALVEATATRYGGGLTTVRDPDGHGKKIDVLLPAGCPEALPAPSGYAPNSVASR